MALEFDQFDTRKYPMLPARDGYREWESTYEQTVLDEMDLDLLDRLTTVPWGAVHDVIDLGCGTGRTGTWLKQAGAAEIDGIDITPLYSEASRVIRSDGHFVIVGFHPYFIMATGMPTHFHRESGEPVAIETHVHLFSDHFAAARRVGLTLIEMDEKVIDDHWIAKKPHWEKHRGRLISFVFVWQKTRG